MSVAVLFFCKFKTFATLLFALLIHTGFSQTLESAGTQTEDLDKKE